MATPTWVRFSPSDASISVLLTQDLEALFRKRKITLTAIAPLEHDDDGTFGYHFNAPLTNTGSISDAIKLSCDWKGIALLMRVGSPLHESFAIHMWRDHEKTNVCLDVSPMMLWHEADGSGPGEWLEIFLLDFTLAIRAKCCGYGRDPDYDNVYAALDCAAVLTRIRNGEILQMPPPSFHLLSCSLIEPDEIFLLLRKYVKNPRFIYKISTNGYHLLSGLR